MEAKYTSKYEQRFWERVDKEKSNIFYASSRCWEWDSYKIKDGYGQMRWCGDRQLSHRVSWLIHYGDIPANMLVLHHCDNPSCCNPNHLFLGTHRDNVRDKMSKGRGGHLRGENHPNHKLTQIQIDDICRRYGYWNKDGDSSHTLAKEYGVGHNTILYYVKQFQKSKGLV